MSIVKAVAVLVTVAVLLALVVLVIYLHRDLTTPMQCRCGHRPALDL